MKTEKELIEIATESNPYKVAAPYGDETRGYKIGFVDGYKSRDKEIMTNKMSDEALRALFEKEVGEPNTVQVDVEALMKIAKEYAGIVSVE
jgi:O-acetylhomoserine/O-acetylserine sulfhydrylase-like pyridoxal-dependent enzyme